VLYHLPSELLLFILDALFEELSLLPLVYLVALMAFTDLAILLFENPVSLLFSKAPLIIPKAICLSFLNYS